MLTNYLANEPRRILLSLVAAACSLVVLLPLAVLIMTSLSPISLPASIASSLRPDHIRPANYLEVLWSGHFGRYIFNSILVSGVATILSVVVDSMAGYAIALLPTRFTRAASVIVVATLIIPAQITMLPLFLIFRSVPLLGGNDILGQGGRGLLNTLWVLIIPSVSSVFGTFLFRDFYKKIPRQLSEAARIDGLSEAAIYLKIFVPLSMPAVAAVSIVTFTEAWNSFLWPLIATSTPEIRTVQLGLSEFRGQYATEWNLLMAGTVISVLPVMLLFLFFQRWFVQGVSNSGIRG